LPFGSFKAQVQGYQQEAEPAKHLRTGAVKDLPALLTELLVQLTAYLPQQKHRKGSTQQVVDRYFGTFVQ
jgi:hypothetical protein